jgi:hypothetical protein
MYTPIYVPIRKLAEDVSKIECPVLDIQDRNILSNDGPKYLRHVQTNIKLKKDLLSDMTDTAKKVLLAYVVFLRQNLTTDQGDKPNEEDAAVILHGDLYGNGKDEKKDLNESLEKQLSKLGISK